MAKTDDWMPLRLQIWRSGTAFMMPEARGPYLDLILAYWELGPLPNQDGVLQQIARVIDGKLWKRIRQQIVDKFAERDGVLYHERCDTERALAKQLHERKSNAGKAGGQASAQARSKQPSTSASSNRSIPAAPNVNTSTTYQEHSPDGEIPDANASGTRKRAPPKVGTRISPDWKPSPQDTKHAEDRQYSRENIEQLASHFCDYHLAKGTVSRDWSASWRTWIANDQKFAGARNGHGRQQPRHNRPEPGGTVDLVARLKAESNLGKSGQRNDGMGRGGDGVHAPDDHAGNPGEGGDAGGIVIDADDAERMFRAPRRAETADESAAGTAPRPGGTVTPLRPQAVGISGGRGAESPDDAAEHSDVVALMGGTEGTPGPIYAAAPPPSGRVESYPESPDFPDRRHEFDPTGH